MASTQFSTMTKKTSETKTYKGSFAFHLQLFGIASYRPNLHNHRTLKMTQLLRSNSSQVHKSPFLKFLFQNFILKTIKNRSSCPLAAWCYKKMRYIKIQASADQWHHQDELQLIGGSSDFYNFQNRKQFKVSFEQNYNLIF